MKKKRTLEMKIYGQTLSVDVEYSEYWEGDDPNPLNVFIIVDAKLMLDLDKLGYPQQDDIEEAICDLMMAERNRG